MGRQPRRRHALARRSRRRTRCQDRPVGSDPRAVAVGGGRVWVAGGEDGTVVRVDPVRPARARRDSHTGSSPAALTVADGSVWTAATAPAAAHRGGTLRLVIPEHAADPANWLNRRRLRLRDLDADVARLRRPRGLPPRRRRRGRHAGRRARHAPAAAESRWPHLRLHVAQGLRYSDGSPVRPGTSARRWSASCASRVTASRRSTPGSSARGAACAGRPAATCRAGSSRIRRRGPSPSISRRRTRTSCTSSRSPFAFVVPAGTPSSDPGTSRRRAPARTGSPRWDSRRGGATRPQPALPPDRAARPAGFADRIEFTRTTSSDSEKSDRRGRARQDGRAAHRPAVRQLAQRAAASRRSSRARRVGAQPPDAELGVDVPQRPAPAVRRPPGARGGQPRHRPRRPRRALRRARARAPELPVPARPRSRASSRTAPTPPTRRAGAGGRRRTSSARAG